MKKAYISILAAALAFSACSNLEIQTPDQGNLNADATEDIQIVVSLPGNDTRVSYEYDEVASVMKASWEEGDQIFFRKANSNGNANQYFTQDGEIWDGGKTTTFNLTKGSLTANTDYILSYPDWYASSSGGRNRIYGQDATLENLKKSDFMIAKVRTGADKSVPQFKMERISAFLMVTDLDFGEGVNTKINLISLIGANMCNRALNYATGDVTNTYRDATITAQPQSPIDVVNGKVADTLYFAFFPDYDAAKGDECKITFTTDDGYFVKEWTAGVKYEPGVMYKVGGKVEKSVTFNINFEDDLVRQLLVYHGWDRDNDQEISNVEASLGTGLAWTFAQTNITSFNEFVYFTGVSEFDGLNTGQSGGFYQCKNLQSITLPPTIQIVDSYGFAECTSLKSIVLPASVRRIHNHSFYKCSSLESVTVPKEVYYFGTGNAFRECPNLKTFDWPDSAATMPPYTFYQSGLETINLPEGIKTIGQYALSETPIKEVVIPEGVTTIDSYAFYNCPNLTKITLPSTLETVGASAFSLCPSIRTVEIADGSKFSVDEYTSMLIKNGNEAVCAFGNRDILLIPEGITIIDANFARYCPTIKAVTIPAVKSMGNYAFADCPLLERAFFDSESTITGNYTFSNDPMLKMVVLPEKAAKLGNYLFQNCSSLTGITIPDAVTSFGDAVFQGTSIESIKMPAGMTSIPARLFENCTSLKSITIPEGVTAIGSWVFKNCSSLTSITIPSGVSRIEQEVFAGCSSLKEVNLPETVTWFNNQCFQNCTSLEKFVFPSKVTQIGRYVLAGCTNLKEVVLPPTLTTIYDYAFSDTGISSIEIPSGVTTLTNGLFKGCKNLSSFTIPSQIKTIQTGVFWGTGLKSFTWPAKFTTLPANTFRECEELESLTIENGVTTINGTFIYETKKLTSLVIPSTVKTLASNCFEGCYVKDVELPETVTNIQMNCFLNSHVESVSAPGATTVGLWAFKNCSELVSVDLPKATSFNQTFQECSSLKDVKIQKVTNLGTWTFQNCTSLESFTIPATATSAGTQAFQGCSKLKEIIVEGTTPFSVSSNSFDISSNNSNVYPDIYVPDSAIDAFKTTGNWATYYAAYIYKMSSR